MIFEGSEHLVALWARDDDLFIGGVLHGTGIDKLRHQVVSDLAGLGLPLELQDLLLHGVELGQLGLSLGVFLFLSELLGLDLLKSSASFARDLKHVY